jgi:glycosyltransferase involved in cell wall biosynthesis
MDTGGKKMFTVQATASFKDMVENKMRRPGDVFQVDTLERVQQLLVAGPGKRGVVKILKAKKRQSNKYEGKKMIIFQNYLYYIGGIETFLQNFTKHYRDKNILLLGDNIDGNTMIVLSQYCDVALTEPGVIYDCDVLLLGNYNGDTILSQVRAPKVYQMIHADWEGLRSVPQWSNFTWKKHPRIDKVIAVSESAAKGLKNTMQYDSEVIYNILDDEPLDDMKVFITLSRATAEKGIRRIVQMAERFKAEDRRFIWYLCCSLEQAPRDIVSKIKNMPEFIILQPGIEQKALISHCDYLVQLSDTESFCYSAFEALQRKVPVILTRFPEAYNIVKPGENGYLVNMDLSDLDVNAIFDKKPKKVTYEDRCDHDKWELVFKGEL